MPSLPKLSSDQITDLAISRGATFAALVGGVLHGQTWIMDNSESEELIFHIEDRHLPDTLYVAIYERAEIYSLGIWAFTFVELYPYIEDKENKDPRGLYGD